MRTTKILAGLAIPVICVGAYAIWYSCLRGQFRETDAMQGCIILGIGFALASVAVGLSRGWIFGAIAMLAMSCPIIYIVSHAMGDAEEREASSAASSALADQFWTVCEGHAVPAAAPLAPLGIAPRPTILFTQPSDRNAPHYAWRADEPWFPSSANVTQLVACIVTSTEWESDCRYDSSDANVARLARLTYIDDVVIREARTGTVVAQTRLRGGEPRPCPTRYTERRGQATPDIVGSLPSDDAIRTFVGAYVLAAEKP